jgi:uncharacterized protein (DUF302 family)
MPESGLVTVRSALDFDATLARLVAGLEARGMTIFARVDHAAGAASVGLALRPTSLVIFGKPEAGTPLMQIGQTAGIDLPLKMLAWRDADGIVWLSYNDPSWIAARHGLGGEAEQAVRAMGSGLEALARHAAGGSR